MVAPAPSIEAVIFDMDGVLLDSEPLWRRAEIAAFAAVGVTLTEDDCRRTMGRRIDEVVAHWHRERPWPDPDLDAVTDAVLDGVAALVAAEGVPLPGVAEAVALAEELGLARAVASSSPRHLIEVTLDRLDLADAFPVVHSAEDEAAGKPDPAVYLSTAATLGVAPAACVAIEDSLNGLRSARAAGMAVVAVPEAPLPADADPSWGEAVVILDSLAGLRPHHLVGGAPEMI